MAKLQIPDPMEGDLCVEFDPKLVDEAIEQAAFLNPENLKDEHKAALKAKAMLDELVKNHRPVMTKNEGEDATLIKDIRDAKEYTTTVLQMMGG